MKSNSQSNNPLVSIIIPVYNSALTISDALESIVSQEYRPIEIIVVDDGSTDQSLDVALAWWRQVFDIGISLRTYKKKNGGPSSARNIGFLKSHGDLIYFLDSDDFLHSYALSESIRFLLNEKAECVVFGFRVITEKQRVFEWLPTEQPAIKSFVDNTLWGYTCSSLKVRALVEKIGPWDEAIRIGEDYEYLSRILLSSKKTVIMRKALLTMRRFSGSLGAQKETEAGLRDRLSAEVKVATNIHSSSVSENCRRSYRNRLQKTAILFRARGRKNQAQAYWKLSKSVEEGVTKKGLNENIKVLAWRSGYLGCIAWRQVLRMWQKSRNIFPIQTML